MKRVLLLLSILCFSLVSFAQNYRVFEGKYERGKNILYTIKGNKVLKGDGNRYSYLEYTISESINGYKIYLESSTSFLDILFTIVEDDDEEGIYNIYKGHSVEPQDLIFTMEKNERGYTIYKETERNEDNIAYTILEYKRIRASKKK